MCGIVAMVGEPDPTLIRGMTRTLAHRGPDGEGMVCPIGEGFGLGHRRLAILDLSSTGAQPMCDASGRYWITYNGEVYNFGELRAHLESQGYPFRSKSDTEVVLASYATWGPQFLDRLNGMFAFAIWDRRDRRLFAARDRIGIKPLYWAEAGGTLLLASEAKAILATGRVPNEVDPEVTHNPWHFTIAPRTGFRHVQKLPPAHWLVWENGHVRIGRWWNINPTETDPGFEPALENLRELLQDAVRLQMISDVPVGAFLSGGLDSSTIVALMRRHYNGPLKTFSISFRSSDRRFEAMPDDQRFARKVAARFGSLHREIELAPNVVEILPRIVWHLDEPLFDPAAINSFLIAQAARAEDVPVLLNGMGVDEVFGGYRKHLACLLSESYENLVPDPARRLIKLVVDNLPVAGNHTGFRTTRWAKRFLGISSLPPTERFLLSDLSIGPKDYVDLYADALQWPYGDLAEVQARQRALEAHELSYLTRMCFSDTTTYLPDHNLSYMDKATMATGVEARPPFLDHRIVEFAFRLAGSYRIRGRRQKVLFREAVRPWLARFVVRRPKASFGAPLRSWIRRDLREMVDDLLSVRALRDRGLYRPEAVRRRIEVDRDGREDYAHFVWNMLCRELWLKAYIDNGGSALREARALFERTGNEPFDRGTDPLGYSGGRRDPTGPAVIVPESGGSRGHPRRNSFS